MAVELEPAELLTVSQAVAADQPVLRVSEEGNHWLLIRQGGIRCQVTARAERSRGLLHLVFSLANCGEQEKLKFKSFEEFGSRFGARGLSREDACWEHIQHRKV